MKTLPLVEGVPPVEWVATNLVDKPAWVIASEEFEGLPGTLEIAGVRTANRRFFDQLDRIDDPGRRGMVFHEYLTVRFALHHWDEYEGNARRSLRNSYIRFLNGWGRDSNGVEGAVLKGWVQSRFGIAPTYHRGVLRHEGGEDDLRYAADRVKGSARTNAIHSQLDLLYQFCQYEIARRWPGEARRRLYRGTNDPEEHPVLASGGDRVSCLRLNNLVSFTAERERAWEFGSTVWESEVVLAKVVFFAGLLPESLLQGEGEYLVIGGNQWVRELLW